MDFFGRHGFRIILISIVLGLAGCARSLEPPGSPPLSGPPLVDLSRVDFTSEDAFLLEAHWDFYWKKFVMPAAFASGAKTKSPAPHARFAGMRPWTETSLDGKRFAGRGFATYRMLVQLPPGREYAFRFQQQLTAYRVYANGQLKIRAGRVGKDRAASRPERKQHILYVKADTKPVEIIVHVSNFHMFRGGLRGILVTGRRGAVDTYTNRKLILDLALLGFFSAIFLYHLLFYFMHRRDLYFLVFAMFSLSFALRIPFMSEKTIWLVHPAVPWDWHLRILGTINIISPGFLMVFLRTLYPDGVPRKAVMPYLLLGLIFLGVHFFDIVYLAPAMYLAYGLLLPVLVHAAWITFRMAFRGDMGALLMAAGVSMAAVFGFAAMYFNWRAADAAPLALFAFSSSILVQAVGIGRIYRDSLTARDKLRSRLIRSQEALSAQRKELEINLHDSLGGALTDLRIIVKRGMQRLPRADDDVAQNLVALIRERLETMSRMFRGQLLFMEDMELASRDPATGLHMTLLRRYSDAGRELIFEIADEARAPFEESMRDDAWRLDILQLTRELCTNDLKYGKGESRWDISMDSMTPGELLLRQSNAAQGVDAEAAPPGRARERARKLGGNLEVETSRDRFSAKIRLPLFRNP